jgi:hypothetical protein
VVGFYESLYHQVIGLAMLDVHLLLLLRVIIHDHLKLLDMVMNMSLQMNFGLEIEIEN